MALFYKNYTIIFKSSSFLGLSVLQQTDANCFQHCPEFRWKVYAKGGALSLPPGANRGDDLPVPPGSGTPARAGAAEACPARLPAAPVAQSPAQPGQVAAQEEWVGRVGLQSRCSCSSLSFSPQFARSGADGGQESHKPISRIGEGPILSECESPAWTQSGAPGFQENLTRQQDLCGQLWHNPRELELVVS